MDTTLADPLIGVRLEGRYRLDARIARGGMATVYRALDERLDRVVAVKVMHAGLADDPRFLARFTGEAKAAARLSSPNVVNVFDQGSHNGLAYLVMELVAGRTLRDLLAERGRLSPAQALSVLEPVLAALAAAHRAGLVHRDVKPENVLLGDDGSVKVADFGLARAVESATMTAARGVLIGTVAYLAPEQVATGAADERTDVYAAGIMLFELLTGSVPYAGETAVSVAYRHLHEDVPPPSTLVAVPPALDGLTVRATRRDPGARPVDAGAFLAELRDVRDDLGLRTVTVPAGPATGGPVQRTMAVPELPPPPPTAAPRRRRRRRLPVAMLIVLVLGLVAGGAGWWLGTGRFTTTPPLTGLTRAQAVTKAQAAGLRVTFGAGAYDEVAPVDSVLAQDPAATARIRKGGTITLTLSLGKERHKIPDVRGRALSDAEAALRSAKLSPQISHRYDDKVDSGKVISQTPAAGRSARPGTLVYLVVSRGPAPVAVPTLVGKNVDDASQQLADAGLRADVTRVYSEQVDKDVVITQNPTGGTLVRGSKVALQVSNGPPPVTVPNVTGKRIGDAKQMLQAAGFKVQVITFFFGDTVFSQSPGGGHKAPKGSTVRILR
ncbi:MAG: Stk1 family PASTA domain-containing Ser/Thr kinase [Actinomycetota bacterium]|nr:Stk1 family PASTA domain-containing Ser/Thr kinase [Actinomycetota bacterium]